MDTEIQIVKQQANEMFDVLVKQIMRDEDIAEELKEQNQMDWVQRMNNIYQRAMRQWIIAVK